MQLVFLKHFPSSFFDTHLLKYKPFKKVLTKSSMFITYFYNSQTFFLHLDQVFKLIPTKNRTNKLCCRSGNKVDSMGLI